MADSQITSYMLECIETTLYLQLWTETDGWKDLKTGWIILIDLSPIQTVLFITRMEDSHL